MVNFFFKDTNCKLLSIDKNLIDKLWLKKSNEKIKKFFTLPEKAVGQNYKLKVTKLINELNKKKN